MDHVDDAIKKIANFDGRPSIELSEIDTEGSSSLSEMGDKFIREVGEEEIVGDRDEDIVVTTLENSSNGSDGENDSEAETVHLEESPNKHSPYHDITLSSPKKFTYNQVLTKQRSDFRSRNIQENKEENAFPGDEVLVEESLDSTKCFVPNEITTENLTAPLDKCVVGSKRAILHMNSDTLKRKRLTLGGTGLEELNQPLRKRTGSVLIGCNGYFNTDESIMEENSVNSAAENISADEEGLPQDEESTEDVEEIAETMNHNSEIPEANCCSNALGLKNKRSIESNILNQEDDHETIANLDSVILEVSQKTCEFDIPVNEEEDETEANLKNEEAIERKRIALNRLSDIERQFSTFRDRLYEERLKQLNDEDFMLRQSQPSHPEYLAWLRCINARRDERIRIADRQQAHKLQCLKKVAVARRSQILAQYQQEIRDLREKKLEQLGEKWYKIQNDRKSSAGVCPEFSLKFPTKRAQQLSNHIAYCNEVSILSGIAKYVGFPAAPSMAPASATELEEDLEKIARSKRNSQAPPPALLHELVALRAVNSNPMPRPAEEHPTEQISWANSQHPLNLHLMQRQVSSSQVPRTISPFTQVQAPSRRLSPQQADPSSGLFLNPPVSHQVSGTIEFRSPQNSLGSLGLSHKISQPRLESRQKSLSPHSSRSLTNLPDSIHHLSKTHAIHNIKSSTLSPVAGVNIDFLREHRLSA